MSWYSTGEPRQDWASNWRHFWTLKEKVAHDYRVLHSKRNISEQKVVIKKLNQTLLPTDLVIRKPPRVTNGDCWRRRGILSTQNREESQNGIMSISVLSFTGGVIVLWQHSILHTFSISIYCYCPKKYVRLQAVCIQMGLHPEFQYIQQQKM